MRSLSFLLVMQMSNNDFINLKKKIGNLKRISNLHQNQIMITRSYNYKYKIKS